MFLKKICIAFLLVIAFSSAAHAQVCKFTSANGVERTFLTIADAITYLNTLPGSGTVKLLDSVAITSTIPLFTGMTFDGDASTISSNDPNLTFIRVNGSGVKIYNTIFDRTVTPGSGNGIDINGYSNVIIDYCGFRRHHNGIRQLTGNSSSITITNSDSTDVNYFTVLQNVSNLTMRDLTVTKAGIRGYGLNNVSGTLARVASNSSGNNGLLIENSPNGVSVTNGYFAYAGQQSVLVVNSSGISFNGTSIETSGWNGSSSNGVYSGLEIVSSSNVTVENVKVFGAASKGVYVKNSSQVTLKNSNVYNNSRCNMVGGSGVYVESSNATKIESNRIYSTQTAQQSPHQTTGLYITGGSGATVTGNTVYGPVNGSHCCGDIIISSATTGVITFSGNTSNTGSTLTRLTAPTAPAHQH